VDYDFCTSDSIKEVIIKLWLKYTFGPYFC